MASYYDARRYSYTPVAPAPAVPRPNVPPPNPTPAPGPTTPTNWNEYLAQGFNPATSIWGEAGRDFYMQNRAQEFFKTRGGHELYDIFRRIYDVNPLAGRAFWQKVVGMGHGQNDLQAATIHRMFGADMNAYNNWLNELHHAGREPYAGNFNLVTGTWGNGVEDANMWNGINNSWNWNSLSQGAWNPYTMQTGLQSLPGHEYDGSEAWNTYSAGMHFGPRGAQYPGVQEQSDLAAAGRSFEPYGGQHSAAGAAPNPSGNIPVPKVPVPGGGRTPVSNPVQPNVAAPSTTNPYATSSGGAPYRYVPR